MCPLVIRSSLGADITRGVVENPAPAEPGVIHHSPAGHKSITATSAEQAGVFLVRCQGDATVISTMTAVQIFGGFY